VARQAYDVVFMDVQMPVMDGLTATRELCRRYPLDTRPRIIGMTANATEEDRRDCIRAGMDDYLAKPVRPQELAAALRASPRRNIGVAAEDDFSAAGLTELRRVYGDDGAQEIIGALLADLESQTAEMQRSLESNDITSLQRVAHTLKSNSRLVGASALGDHWDEVERLTQTDAAPAAGRLVLALMGRYGRLVRHLLRETRTTTS
jgi:CheY-like chemotaxis protein